MCSKQRDTVAKRELMFSFKGESVRRKVTVRVHRPVEVQPGDVSFDFSAGTACCRVEFEGLDEPEYVAHGADTLQALALAVDIDPILRGMSKRYDFYFDTGEDYFEE
jgi:hypothetical protein